MPKTIKFNLNCDGASIRTNEDLREHFCIQDVLDYYKKGILARWLKVHGYNAGSTVGQAVVKGAQVVRDFAYEGIKSVCSGIKSAVSTVGSFFSDCWSAIFG